jgi:hypothetical protein
MKCKTSEERLEALLSGDLAPFEQTKAQQHRATCAHCQALVERATRMDDLLRGELPTMLIDHDGQPDTITARVTLFVDAETYWLLGREESVEGEDRPPVRYQTVRFDLVAPAEVPETAFTLTPPEEIDARQIDGLEPGYQNPTMPHVTLEEAAKPAPFTLLLPATLPTGLEMRPIASIEPFASTSTRLTQVYENGVYGWMVLSEYEGLIYPGYASRPVEISGKRAWVERDLIYSNAFTVYLSSQWDQDETPADNSLPGSVVLAVRGYSLDEAIAVLGSLEPYTP